MHVQPQSLFIENVAHGTLWGFRSGCRCVCCLGCDPVHQDQLHRPGDPSTPRTPRPPLAWRPITEPVGRQALSR